MVRRVSTLVSTRNSKILSRHNVRPPVRSGKTIAINSVLKDRRSTSSSGSKVSEHQDSLEIETATMGSSFAESCETETGTMGSSFPVSCKTNVLSDKLPVGHVGQSTGSSIQKKGSTGNEVSRRIRSRAVPEERELLDNETIREKYLVETGFTLMRL